MIPPIASDASLAAMQNKQPDMQELTIGQQPAAPVASTQATTPTEQSSDPNADDTANLSNSGILLSNGNSSTGGVLKTLEDAKSAVAKVLQQLNQSPTAGLQAQGNTASDFVNNMLQNAPPAPA